VSGEARAFGGKELLDAGERGIRTGYHVAVEIFVECLPVHRCRGQRVAGDCAGAGREYQRVTDVREAQTLDPGAVDCKRYAAFAGIDQDEGEIATQGLFRIPSPALRQAASAADA
jgi:hypothetical protein